MKFLKQERYFELLKKEKSYDRKFKEMEENQFNLQQFYKNDLYKAEGDIRLSEGLKIIGLEAKHKEEIVELGENIISLKNKINILVKKTK